MARLLYGCGLRVCEPLDLRLKDVDLRERTLVIREAKGGKDRGGWRCRSVWSGKWRGRGEWRGPSGAGIVAAGVSVALPGLLARKSAGLAGRATPHVLRHSYATHAHRSGAAARDLQEVLGHRQLETTMRYLAAEPGRVRSPVEALAIPAQAGGAWER